MGRRSAAWVAGLAVVVLLAAGCTVARRARTYPTETEITSVEWYTPSELVRGRSAEPLEAVRATRNPFDAATLDAVHTWLAERNTTGFVVLHRGKIADEWYAEGHDATSATNSMSMSKTVTALMVGLAQEDGFIPDVDEPVASILTELERDKRRSITFRDLLEMTSGLRNDTELRLGSDLVKMHLGTHLERTVLAIPAERVPGHDYDYNNANTQLLATAIERATGRRYAEYLSERLWRPLGASDAELWLDRRNGTAHAYCCLFAGVQDWARLGQMMLDGGRVDGDEVVPREWLVRMTLPSKHNPDYGWHVWRADNGVGSERAKDRSEPLLDERMFWLDGKGAQKVYVMPREHLVIVRVGEEPPEGVEWDDAYLPNTLMRAVQASEAAEAAP